MGLLAARYAAQARVETGVTKTDSLLPGVGQISAQDRRHNLMAQQPNLSRAKTESTSAGEQHVIPGAEKVSDAEIAKRKAGEPLKPKVRQKPADEGLFGDEANQTDLVDLAGRRPFRN